MSSSTTARTARRRTLRMAAAGWSGIQSSDGAASPDATIGITSVAAGKQSGGAQSARAKTGSPVRTQTLVDGSTAKIYDLGSQRYRAEIVSDGSVVATMETTGQDADAGLDANGVYIVLSAGGVISAHR